MQLSSVIHQNCISLLLLIYSADYPASSARWLASWECARGLWVSESSFLSEEIRIIFHHRSSMSFISAPAFFATSFILPASCLWTSTVSALLLLVSFSHQIGIWHKWKKNEEEGCQYAFRRSLRVEFACFVVVQSGFPPLLKIWLSGGFCCQESAASNCFLS